MALGEFVYKVESVTVHILGSHTGSIVRLVTDNVLSLCVMRNVLV